MMVPASYLMEPVPVVVAKQQWQRNGNPDWKVKIMGVVENHVVYRRKGASPEIRHINDFLKTFTIIR